MRGLLGNAAPSAAAVTKLAARAGLRTLTVVVPAAHAVEVAAVGLAIERLDAAIERRLRGLVDWEEQLDGDAAGRDLQRLHAALGEMSGDAALRRDQPLAETHVRRYLAGLRDWLD